MRTRSITGVLARKDYAEKKRNNKKSTIDEREESSIDQGPYAASEAVVTKMRELTAREERERKAEHIAEQLRKKKKNAELALIAKEDGRPASGDGAGPIKNAEKRKRQTPPGIEKGRSRTTSATGSAKEKIARLAAHGRAVAAAGTMVIQNASSNLKCVAISAAVFRLLLLQRQGD